MCAQSRGLPNKHQMSRALLLEQREQNRRLASIGPFSLQHINQRNRRIQWLQTGAQDSQHLRDIVQIHRIHCSINATSSKITQQKRYLSPPTLFHIEFPHFKRQASAYLLKWGNSGHFI